MPIKVAAAPALNSERDILNGIILFDITGVYAVPSSLKVEEVVLIELFFRTGFCGAFTTCAFEGTAL